MSASKVKFAPIEGAGRNDIPTDHAPTAIAMAAGKDGANRKAEEFAGLALRASGVVDQQFPTDQLTKSSPKDELMTTKLALSAGQKTQVQDPDTGNVVDVQTFPPGTTPFGKLVAKDEDFKWLQSKRDQEAEANFQQWFAQNFDFMSPEQKAAARELFPSFYEQRLKLLDKDLDTLRELARIKITGITNRRDLLLTYAAEGGYFDIDRLQNLLNPELAQANQNTALRTLRYTRGLLNPRRTPRGVYPPTFADPSQSTNGVLNAASGMTSRPVQGGQYVRRTKPTQASQMGPKQGFNITGANYYGELQNMAPDVLGNLGL